MSRRGCGTVLILVAIVVIVALTNQNKKPQSTEAPPAGFTVVPNSATQDVLQGTARVLGLTATVTASATITDTPAAVATARATLTGLTSLSDNPVVTPISELMYVMQTANARSCPSTECEILGKFQKGETFGATGATKGDSVNGNNLWYETKYNGLVAYVNSGLVVNNNVVAQPQQVQSTVPPVSVPVQQVWSCSGDIYDCDSFSSRAEMDAYWNACPGDPSNLDGNGDNEYCESN